MSAKNPQPGDICQIKRNVDILQKKVIKNTIGCLYSKGFIVNTYFIRTNDKLYLLHRSDFTIKRIKKLKPNKPFKYIDKEVI